MGPARGSAAEQERERRAMEDLRAMRTDDLAELRERLAASNAQRTRHAGRVHRWRSETKPLAVVLASVTHALPHAHGRESNHPAPTRSRGSRRTASASRAGPSDDPDPGEPERRCSCGCGASLEGRRPQTVHATDACRMRAGRATAERAERDRVVALIAELACTADVRRALRAFVALSIADRAAVVEALGLDRDDDGLRLVVAPALDAEMVLAA